MKDYKETKQKYEERYHQKTIRFKHDEFTKLEDEARKYGVTTNFLIHKRATKKDKLLLKEPKINIDTRKEINKIGVNLNQVAKAINSNGIGVPNAIEILNDIKKQLILILNKII